jgi:acetyl-CoA carboxylase biotin carboxyl carrier protein
MPETRPTGDRTPAQRQADHASLARLSESLVPALVQKLAASGLGELEVREGDWRIRLRRSPGSTGSTARRAVERPRMNVHERDGRGRDPHPQARGADRSTSPAAGAGPRRSVVTSPAVGVFRPEAAVGRRLRAGDRIGTVDLLGIPQDIIAPIDGTLAEVIAQAGEAVEYGEEVAVVEAEAVDVAAETTGEDGEAGT